MTQKKVQPARILMVEDDEDDVLFTQRAMEKGNIWNQLDVVRNGQQALDYLHHEHDYADPAAYPRPDLILLDLNLPGIDGREFLKRMSADPDLKNIPVAITSTSDYERDIEFGRAHGVQHYLIKPIQVDNLLQVFTTLPGFCLVFNKVIE